MLRSRLLVAVLASASALVAVMYAQVVAEIKEDPLRNGGFEAAKLAESWEIDPSETNQGILLTADEVNSKEGRQSLLIEADHPAHLTLRQETFLPIGTLWRLTGWDRSAGGQSRF